MKRINVSPVYFLIAALLVALSLFGHELASQTPLPGLTDKLAHPPVNYNGFTPPSAGGTYVDPVFGSTIRRITSDGQPDDIYAKNMWWNADATRYVHLGGVYNPLTGQKTHTIPRGNISGDSGFDPIDPNVYYYLSGSRIKKVLLNANGTTAESDFYVASGTLDSLGSSQNWWTADGAQFIVSVGGQVRVVDRDGSAWPGSINASAGSGWVTIAPSGNHVVAYGNNTASAWSLTRASRTIGSKTTPWDKLCGDHGTVMSASDGKDYLIIKDCYNRDLVMRVNVDNHNPGGPGNENTQINAPGNKILQEGNWQNDGHYSAIARGPLRDYVCYDTEYAGDGFNSSVPSNWPAYRQEIMCFNVLTGETRRLAHHRSRNVGDYSNQPRISASWDGQYIAFASNMNVNGKTDIYAVAFGSGDVVIPPPIDPPPPGAVDCVTSAWGPWSAWAPINATTEARTRTRTVVTPPSNGGLACGPLVETETRPIVVVPPQTPVDCVVEWRLTWTSGTSARVNRVTITPAANGGKACATTATVVIK